MDKENLVKLVDYLNSRKNAFIFLSNNQEYSHYFISDISFGIIKQELYKGDLPVTGYCLKISVRRFNKKRNTNKIIITSNPDSILELDNWYLIDSITTEIYEKISDFSDSLHYSKAANIFM